MLLINCGIKRVVCERKYQKAGESEQMLADADVEVAYKHDEVQEYPGRDIR
jgi:dCMP deaminase